MRSEEEIRQGMRTCRHLNGFGVRKSACPMEFLHRGTPRCEDCTFLATLFWVLGESWAPIDLAVAELAASDQETGHD